MPVRRDLGDFLKDAPERGRVSRFVVALLRRVGRGVSWIWLVGAIQPRSNTLGAPSGSGAQAIIHAGLMLFVI